MEKRIDLYTTLLIDTVLNVSNQQGINVSVHALRSIGLSPEVAARISTRPAERRASVRIWSNSVLPAGAESTPAAE
jgi:hypothetical protein